MVYQIIFLLLTFNDFPQTYANIMETQTSNVSTTRPTDAQIWGIGLGFVTLISVCSCAGIALMLLLSEAIYHKCLIYFVGLGVGSLCGSSVFHLIPHTFHLGEYTPLAMLRLSQNETFTTHTSTDVYRFFYLV